MSLLNSILLHKPQEWDHLSYSNRRYARITLQAGSMEYQEVKREFTSKFGDVKVISIERIQHPFAYGRYKLRKEQLIVKNNVMPTERRMFLSITDESKIDIVIDYNCDARRGGFTCSSYLHGNGWVLVVKIFGHNFNERDTHRYPEYIIRYESIKLPGALESHSYDQIYRDFEDLFLR